tara:strand:- start:10322 stop:11092 length:771 start_codon:yes stop_codon:yes gene_type:complete
MKEKKNYYNVFLKVFLLLLLVVNVHLFLFESPDPKIKEKNQKPVVPLNEGRSFMEKPALPSLNSEVKTNSTSSFIGKDFSRESIAKAIYSTSRTTSTPIIMPQMVSSFSEKIKTGSKISLKVTSDGYIEVPFVLLQAYTYKGENKFPKAIQQLHEKKISIVGFTMPIEVNDERKVISSLLIKDPPGCCFGDSPKLNDWLMLEVDPSVAEVPLWASSPFKIFGEFTAGEIHEGGEIISIYQLKTEKIEKFTVTKRWW